MTQFMGEFLGTATLILLGDGVVAGVLLAKSKAHNAGWIVITAGWAFAVMSGAFVAQAFGGSGSLNPAGTIGGMLSGSVSTQDGLMQIAGEFAGAFVGAVLVWLHYMPHWGETQDAGAKLGVFCTGPAIRNAPFNLLGEIIATFVLILVASAIGKLTTDKGLTPLLIGSVIWGIGLSLGGTTGYSLNPARDLSPRIAHAVLPIPGKGGSDWGYSWIPVVGPILGAIAATLLVQAIGK